MNVSQSGRGHRKSGFTLIELLIVMAIIGIIAAMLLPVFSRVRENARRATCQSNLKQLGLGIMQYTQDYDERYPLLVHSGSSGLFNSATTWCDGVEPYVKTKEVFFCPSQTKGSHPHYGMNILLSKAFNYEFPGPEQVQFASSEVFRPTEVIMLSDIRISSLTGYKSDYDNDPPNGQVRYVTFPGHATRTSADLDMVMPRHLSGANYAFFDGHVKWFGFTGTDTATPDSTVYDRLDYAADANNLVVTWPGSPVRTRTFWRINK